MWYCVLFFYFSMLHIMYKYEKKKWTFNRPKFQVLISIKANKNKMLHGSIIEKYLYEHIIDQKVKQKGKSLQSQSSSVINININIILIISSHIIIIIFFFIIFNFNHFFVIIFFNFNNLFLSLAFKFLYPKKNDKSELNNF